MPNTHKTPTRAQPPLPKRRIPPAIRLAIDTYITTGVSKTEAAAQAGISAGHLYNYEMRPHVKEYAEQKKAAFIQSVEAMRPAYRAHAFEVARDLMQSSSSDSVKMRAVEFLAGESKQNAVNVQINNNLAAPHGYEFVPPGVEIVTIRAADDAEADTTYGVQGDQDQPD